MQRIIGSVFGLFVALAGIAKAAPPTTADATVQWIEAEDYDAQFGSTAARYQMGAASGGACVDNDWGGKAGHYLRYRVRVPAEMTNLYLTLRYARETAGDAAIRLILDGNTGQSVLVRLPSTGDWGFKSEGWKYAAAQLPTVAPGVHAIEIRSEADRNNVNFDGFYLSAAPLDTRQALDETPSGPEALAPLGPGLAPLPCRTPLALPYSHLKAVVSGNGSIHSLLSTPDARGMGGNLAGPVLRVMLAGHGPWQSVTQMWSIAPVPVLITRLQWPEVTLEQSVFAATPESQGFFVRVTVSNQAPEPRAFELVSRLDNAPNSEASGDGWLTLAGQPLLGAFPTLTATTTVVRSALPGPLGEGIRLRHRLRAGGGQTAGFELQFLGRGQTRAQAFETTANTWSAKLAAAARVELPDPVLQYAFDASLRQMLMLVEQRPDHARILKGLQHYYGANPYDTFQVSRALDAVGLRSDAEEILRHQITHLKRDGIFEMWETGDLQKCGPEQWIVQGLTAVGLWNHYEMWGEEAWLREIAPALVRAAQATLEARRQHPGRHPQGAVMIEGWLPPIGGDGGLGVGYHWSQNAGPLAGVRLAAEAARRLRLPEAESLRAGWLDFQRVWDQVRQQTAQSAGMDLLPAYPGAEREAQTRPLWGVVMSVTSFDAIPLEDTAALGTLRFLQRHQHEGLHLNLGYSRGVWPYLSAEVAQWHLRLGEFAEAWRILKAIVDRASTTVCWYEEIDYNPPRGHGDPADIWAAAEVVYLTRQLLLSQQDNELRICAGLPSDYMRPGQAISARALPIAGGTCSFEMRFGQHTASAKIEFNAVKIPSRLRLCLSPAANCRWRNVEVSGAANPTWNGRDLVVAVPSRSVQVKAEQDVNPDL